MKRILLLFGFFVITTTGLYAQVGIGTRDPHATAQLEVTADNKGVLIPRVELKAIENQSPIVGTMTNSLLVYNTVTNTGTKGQEVYPGYYFWYKNAWNRVVSQNDFSNTDITNKILKGSNIVTYNSKSNTLNYYTEDGTSTSVSIVDVINNTDSSTTISVTKIEAGAPGQVLTTNSSSVVEWQALSSVLSKTLEKTDLKLGEGLEFNEISPGVTSKTATDLVFGDKTKPVTLKVKDLDLSALKGAPGEDGRIITIDKEGNLTATETIKIKNIKGDPGKDGQILTVDNNGVVTYTNEIDASKIQRSNLTSADGIKIDGAEKAENVILGNKEVKITVDNLDVSKIGKGGATEGQVITTDGTTVKWGKLSGENIDGKKLTGIKGIKVNPEDNLALLQSVTLSVDELPITSIDPNGGEDKLLTVKGGNVTWTNELPEGTTVSVTNIKTATPTTSGTDTSTVVVTIDPNTGVATTTTIKELVSNTVTVGNGLSKDDKGKIVLGGDLEKDVTTITAADDKKLAITGLTNTATTADDKVMVLGKDNVLHTVSITSLKGSGDYTVTNTYSVDTDKETGNTFNDGTKSYPEKIRTVEIPLNKDSANYLSSENLKLEGYDSDKILVTEVKIFSKGKIKTTGTEKRSVTFSAANYTIEGNLGVVEPGISSGGLSAPIYRGTYYVTIKYIDKTK